MPWRSHRFWLLVLASFIAVLAYGTLVVRPEQAGHVVALTAALEGVIAVVVHSDGSRRLGQR